MITNERQLKISKAQADKFRHAIKALGEEPLDETVPQMLREAELEGLRSQLEDLEQEIRNYEELRSGDRSVSGVHAFDDLPRALVEARIASGLTQSQLASRLELKPQQIQRYEATSYQSASLARLSEIARALGVKVRRDILSVEADASLSRLKRRLAEVGLDRDFVARRLLPRAPGSLEEESEDKGSATVPVEALEAISRIYGWSPAALFGQDALTVARGPSRYARFKLPARIRERGLEAYVVYAHYLALLVLAATPDLKPETLSDDPSLVRREILEEYGDLTFETALRYTWARGIPVLPINDPGKFHGACWRIEGRNIIVLRQRTQSASRWLHDLLHEFYHAAQRPDLLEHGVIEEAEMSKERRESAEEKKASRFAGDVMLDSRAEELAARCVESAQGEVARLKSAVRGVATQAGVSVPALANYMAFRLSLQGINWWGAATNLQDDGTSMLCTPRDLLLTRVKLAHLNPIDRDVLLRALEPIVLAFAGGIGSGKSTLSQLVADALGWKTASFGDYIRSFARSQGLEPTREVLQELGESLVARGPEQLCSSVLTHFDWHAGEPLVIEGVRHSSVLGALRRLVAPLDLRLVFITVDRSIRLKRLEKDGEIASRLDAIDAHSTEREVNKVLSSLAAWHVHGDRPPEEVVREIVSWVHQGDGTVNSCSA